MSDSGKKAVVTISLSGSRWEDARRALNAVREKFGNPQWSKPRGWVWHHTGEGGKIQLAPARLHGELSHTGGFAQYPSVNTILQPRRLGASPYPIEDSYAPLRPQTLDRFEQLLEVKLPEQYRQFLLQSNGGRPRLNGFRVAQGDRASDEMLDYFLGIAKGEEDDIVTSLQRYADRLAPGLLPIAYDAFGNLICLGLMQPFAGQVFFWDHELEPENGHPDLSNVALVALSFGAFLKCFFADEVNDSDAGTDLEP